MGTAAANRTALDRLVTLAGDLGADEQAVLATIAERLVLGRRVYGPLTLATDARELLELARLRELVAAERKHRGPGRRRDHRDGGDDRQRGRR
jgi:hypothetical protein